MTDLPPCARCLLSCIVPGGAAAFEWEPVEREELIATASLPAQMGEKALGQQAQDHRFHQLLLGNNSVLVDGDCVAVKPGLSDSGSVHAFIQIAVGRGVSGILTARKQVLHEWNEQGREKTKRVISPCGFSGLTHEDLLTFGSVVCVYDVSPRGKSWRTEASVAYLRELLPRGARGGHKVRMVDQVGCVPCDWQDSSSSRRIDEGTGGLGYCDISYLCESKSGSKDDLGMGAKEEASSSWSSSAAAVIDNTRGNLVRRVTAGPDIDGSPGEADIRGDCVQDSLGLGLEGHAEGKSGDVSPPPPPSLPPSRDHCGGSGTCKGCLACGFLESKVVMPVKGRDPNPGRCYDVPESLKSSRDLPRRENPVAPVAPQALPAAEPVAMESEDQGDGRSYRVGGALFARQVSMEEGDDGDANGEVERAPEADGYAADNAEHGSEGCEDTIDDDSEGLGSRIVPKPASPAWIMPRSLRPDFLDGVLPSCAAADAEYPSDVSLGTVVDVEESSDVDKTDAGVHGGGGSSNGQHPPSGTEACSSGDFVPGGDEEPQRSEPETSSNPACASVGECVGEDVPPRSAEADTTLPEASVSHSAERNHPEGGGGGGGGGDGSVGSVSGNSPEWSCERCTLYNPSVSPKCAACGYVRVSKRRLRTNRARPERLEYERIPQKARNGRRKRDEKRASEGIDDRNARAKRPRVRPAKIRHVHEGEGGSRGNAGTRKNEQAHVRERGEKEGRKLMPAVSPGERCSSAERTADGADSTTSDTNIDPGLPTDGESEGDEDSVQTRADDGQNGSRSGGTESSVAGRESSDDNVAAKRKRAEAGGRGRSASPDLESTLCDTGNNVVSVARSGSKRRVKGETANGPEPESRADGASVQQQEENGHPADLASMNGGDVDMRCFGAVGVSSQRPRPPYVLRETPAGEHREVCPPTRSHYFDDVEVIQLRDSSGSEACTEAVNEDDELPEAGAATAYRGPPTSLQRQDSWGARNSTDAECWSADEGPDSSRSENPAEVESAEKRRLGGEAKTGEGAGGGEAKTGEGADGGEAKTGEGADGGEAKTGEGADGGEAKTGEGADGGGDDEGNNGKATASEGCEGEPRDAGGMGFGRTNSDHENHPPRRVPPRPSGRAHERESDEHEQELERERERKAVPGVGKGKAAAGKRRASLGRNECRGRAPDSPNGSERSRDS